MIFSYANSRIISIAQQSLISRKVSYLASFSLFTAPSFPAIGVGGLVPPGKTAPTPPPPPVPPPMILLFTLLDRLLYYVVISVIS